MVLVLRCLIWLVLAASCVLWGLAYFEMEAAYGRLLQQYHLQKDCDWGIPIRPFKKQGEEYAFHCPTHYSFIGNHGCRHRLSGDFGRNPST
jgi:hypothetical protein